MGVPKQRLWCVICGAPAPLKIPNYMKLIFNNCEKGGFVQVWHDFTYAHADDPTPVPTPFLVHHTVFPSRVMADAVSVEY